METIIKLGTVDKPIQTNLEEKQDIPIVKKGRRSKHNKGDKLLIVSIKLPKQLYKHNKIQKLIKNRQLSNYLRECLKSYIQ